VNRKDFIKNCGYACMGGGTMFLLLNGCTTTRAVSSQIVGDNLTIPLSDFEIKSGDKKQYKKYVVVQNDRLQYPVCIYRFSELEYTALWMQCTHQGTELQVFGDKLQCPAHGSEFDSKGNVSNGPADRHLRTFPVVIKNNHLSISLKAS
jgi:Rieske Fe-S protein